MAAASEPKSDSRRTIAVIESLTRKSVILLHGLPTTGDATETTTSDATGTSEAETESREGTTETDAADPGEFRITVTDGDEEVELVTGEDVKDALENE